MPKLPFNYQRSNGFTLIEMMAVLVVIAVAAGMVSLSIGDGARPQQVKTSARILYNSIQLAVEDAVFTNHQIGLRFDVQVAASSLIYRYDWYVYDVENKLWSPYTLDKDIDTRLPEGVMVNIEVDGQRLIIGEKSDDDALLEVKKQDGDEEALYPDLYFLSSGEVQDFRIHMSTEEHEDKRYLIRGNILGQIDFYRPHEDEEN